MLERPSLKSLRVLLEVARGGSYAGAAERLGVTPSAVSHMVASLDAELGGVLFEDRRRARLSVQGAQLVRRLEPAFQSIEHALGELRAQRTAIRLSTLSSFAMLWLIPRLQSLRQRMPDVDILISTDTRPVDLAAEPFDAAIRWTARPPDAPGLYVMPLFRERWGIVASPALVGSAPREIDPLRLPRLKARSRMDDWVAFLPEEEAGRTPVGGVTVFETRGQMLEATLGGLGAAVIDLNLVGASLAAGTLVVIGEKTVQRPEAYYLLCRKGALGERPLRILRDWLAGEASGETYSSPSNSAVDM
ncbi:Gcv operon activator [Hartmannibacter diazotrophicus]|uniref:Gcv operon activator n=1 Tax=Hartmannibacter diazotrophicus TaxID=1482074 RepID=A0A2C9D0G2_9HYPH|nr:LysR substrate-binding domain-containing protein [Hartmannibacter diazotrophicus]SON53724.1 Gcv operon activator [Hartmannibacter diazotrophicus]